MKRGLFFISALVALIMSINANAREFSVLDYGARGDGKQLNTQFIQQAIDAASASGGIVVFPAGDYVTGTLYLKSNVTIELQKGATLYGSHKLAHYPENMPEYNFFRKGIILRALIFAEKAVNISIVGEGTIDGQGFAFPEPTEKGVSSYSVRPYVIWMVQCKRVRVEGIKLQNGPFWMQHYMACENVRIHNIEVFNHGRKNNDMMDIDGCKDVIISDCRGDTDDDGITIKSTHAMPNENITITNCVLSSHCNAIKCGTETNAGFKNITISNCVIRPSSDTTVTYGKLKGISGISLEVVDGAVMDGVNISNIVMDGPAVPLFIRLGNRARGYDKSLPKPEVGRLENVSISNITAFNAKNYGSSLTGIPGHPIKNIHLQNIRFYYEGGGSAEDASREIDQRETKYPEATMFGVLPSYGMFIRHVENVTMSDVEFYTNSADQRAAFYMEDVTYGQLENVHSDLAISAPLIKAVNLQNFSVSQLSAKTNGDCVISLSGEDSKEIYLSGIIKKNFSEVIRTEEEVDPGAVSIGAIYK